MWRRGPPVHVLCGGASRLLLRRKVHSCGTGMLGALGGGDFVDRPQLQRVDGLEGANRVACGWAHSAAIKNGQLFTFGRTHDMRSALSLAKMARGGSITSWLAQMMTRFGGSSGVESLVPVKVELGYDGEGSGMGDGEDDDWYDMEAGTVGQAGSRAASEARAVDIACGGALTAVVTAAGEVRCMGMNHYGQCGGGHDEPRVWDPEVLLGLGSERAARVALGFQHGIVLTQSGRVFTWGKGERGQLGRGRGARRQTIAHAVKIPTDGAREARVAQVGAGFATCTVRMDDGSVYVWGKVMSLARVDDESEPADDGSTALADEGDDRDEENEFSVGEKLRRGFRDQMSPRQLPFESPVRDMACSQFHTCFRTEDGRLWLAGVRGHGQPQSPALKSRAGSPILDTADSFVVHQPIEVSFSPPASLACTLFSLQLQQR